MLASNMCTRAESSRRDGGNRAFQSDEVNGQEGLHGCRNLSKHTDDKYLIIDSNVNQNRIAHRPDPVPKLIQKHLQVS